MAHRDRCTIEGCERKFYGRGWCKNHYNVNVKEVGYKALGLPKCSLSDCDNTHYGRGYCRLHWERWKINGDPLKTQTLYGLSVADRLKRKTKREGACVVWTGYRDKDGYGELTIKGKPVRAHRASYEAHRGTIPPGLVVRHKCDNPPCVRIEHLELGTIRDNNRDREERGKGTQGSRNGAAVLNEAQVLLIYDALQRGATLKSLAIEFGVGTSTILRIKHRNAWRMLLDNARPEVSDVSAV